MTIDTAHIRTGYLLATISFAALVISGEIPLYLVLLGGLSIGLTYYFERRGMRPELPQGLWNGIAILFFLYEGLYSVFGRRELILNVTEFLIVIQSIRLWSRKTDRQYLQIFGLSLLQLIAAAVLTADVSFALIYLSYIVAGTWALVVFNLRRELTSLKREQIYLQQAAEVLTPRFFAVLSVISLAVFLSSMIIFALFPRLNYNYFAPLLERTVQSTGFSNQIRLGEIGQIKLNQKVVMRIKLSGPAAEKIRSDNLYMRGLVLNHYDGKRWQYVSHGRRELVSIQRSRYTSLLKSAPEANLVQEIVLEPIETKTIFALKQALGLESPMGLLSHSEGENISGEFAGGGRIKYTIHSYWQDPAASSTVLESLKGQAELKNSGERKSYDSFLQIPRRMDPRIAEFARGLTQNSKDPVQKARILNSHLHNRFGYTLKMADPGNEDPLAHFLLKEKAGHCEYFAAALAMMLRTLGIPSRVVNGYYHGEWNEVGKFYLIRESDAHAWVEALLPGPGGEMVWTQFDPTPPDPAFLAGRFGLWNRWQQTVDSLRLLWVNWIVDYDIRTQANTFESGFRSTQRLGLRFELGFESLRKFFGGLEKVDQNQETRYHNIFAVAFCLLFFGVGFYAARRVWQKPRLRPPPEFGFYKKTLRLLKKHGIQRPLALTPWEFCALAQEKLQSPATGELSSHLNELTDLFCALRYGEKTLNAEDQTRATHLVARLKIVLKQAPTVVPRR